MENVQAKWFNTSAVDVSWDHAVLPKDVRVLEYTVYISHGYRQLLHDGEAHRMAFAPDTDHSIVAGLHSHTNYSLSMTARIRDSDGTEFETRLSRDFYVFVPGMLISLCSTHITYHHMHNIMHTYIRALD